MKIPWKKCCHEKSVHEKSVSQNIQKIFLAEEEGQGEGQGEGEEELSLPVLLLWQAANASREPRVLFNLILMQYNKQSAIRIFFVFFVFFVEQIIIFDSKKKKLFYLPVRLK